VKKVVLLGTIAFVVALGGATGVGIMLRHAPEEKTAPDSAREIEGDPTGESAPSAQPPDTASTAQESAAAVADEAESAPEQAQDLAVAVPEVEPTAEESTQAASQIPEATTEGTGGAEYRQLAKILASMKPKEAAGIMAYLTDEQAAGILRSLGVRDVAELLAAMPVERAAILSQQLIDQPKEE